MDHTLVQEKLASGELKPAQAARHPSADVLTRAVGVHQTLHLELDYDKVETGDRYLLCSDGLYNDLRSSDIEQLLGHGNTSEALDKLIERAMSQSGRDNITAVIAEVNNTTDK
jgi:serine/threonine protein phosphatase PrpC